MTWPTRTAAELATGRANALGLLIAYVIALVVSVLGQLRGVLNVLGWMPVAIQVFFAVGLAYALAAGALSCPSGRFTDLTEQERAVGTSPS
jgi:hypothetical protein